MNEQHQEKRDTAVSLIKKSRSIAVLPSKLNGNDAFFAGVSLFYMLKKLENKDVNLIYPGRIPEDAADIIKTEDITKNVKDRSLMVSIDYSGTDASNVHYTTEDDVLRLKISPIPQDFDKHTRIRAKIDGHDYDLLIIIGAPDQDELGWDLNHLNISLDNVAIMNIDNSSENVEFGDVNVLDTKSTSISLLVLQNAPSWGLTVSEKAAKPLLKGIVSKELPYRG